MRPTPVSSPLLSRGISRGVQGRESNPGLPYSRPTHCYLSYAAPYLSYAAPSYGDNGLHWSPPLLITGLGWRWRWRARRPSWRPPTSCSWRRWRPPCASSCRSSSARRTVCTWTGWRRPTSVPTSSPHPGQSWSHGLYFPRCGEHGSYADLSKIV